MLEKSIAKSNDTVLWWCIYFDFKVHLSLFLDFMWTVYKDKTVCNFDQFLIFKEVILEVWRLLIGMKVKNFTILMTLSHWVNYPIIMCLVIERNPVNIGFILQLVLNHDLGLTGINVFYKDFVELRQSITQRNSFEENFNYLFFVLLNGYIFEAVLEMEMACRFLNDTSKSSSIITPFRGFPTILLSNYINKS